jgi:ABC-2 type transport system ATP-binding protein
MLQRIGLAQALLNEPELLILDEPMSGLDPLGRRVVRKLLQDLKQDGTTILLSTHIVPDVEALADKVAILKHGLLAGIHDMHDLAARARASHYEVVLDRMPHGAIADVVRGCRCVPLGPRQSSVAVHVPDLERLQRMLAWCSDLGT